MMIIPMIIFEGIVLSFIVLVGCVVGIANGPVGLVCLYERGLGQMYRKWSDH